MKYIYAAGFWFSIIGIVVELTHAHESTANLIAMCVSTLIWGNLALSRAAEGATDHG